MKIAFIAVKDLPYIGGLEKYTVEIGKRMVEEGHEVTVFTVGRESRKEREYLGMKIRPVKTIKLKGIERFVANSIATISASFANYDIIHYHSYESTLLSFMPKLFGKKILYQGHGLEWERDRWGSIPIVYFKTTNWIVNKMPSVFFNVGTVVSNHQKKYYKTRYGNDYIFTPTGINIPKAISPDKIKLFNLCGKDYLFFAARLVKEKGAHYLISAYINGEIYKKTGIRLVIAGDAPDEKNYINYLHELAHGVPEIIFTGSIYGELLSELYSNCRCFVLPSTIEGMPISLLEAMSYGVPTLASDIAPNLETTNNGEYGYHFKNRDIDDLAVKMMEVLSNIAPAIQKGAAAKKYVCENYTWDKIYKQYNSIYSQMLKA